MSTGSTLITLETQILHKCHCALDSQLLDVFIIYVNVYYTFLIINLVTNFQFGHMFCCVNTAEPQIERFLIYFVNGKYIDCFRNLKFLQICHCDLFSIISCIYYLCHCLLHVSYYEFGYQFPIWSHVLLRKYC